MAVYTPPSDKTLAFNYEQAKVNNQRVLSGTDPTLAVVRGVFFLEYLLVSSGTVDIKDGQGNTIASGVSAYNAFSPLRCEYGITLTGSVAIAKGFVLQEVLAA